MSNIKVYSIDQLKDIFTEVKDRVNSLQMVEMVELKPFAECTPFDVVKIAKAYYDGMCSLEDIKAVWSVGDYINIDISAIESYNGSVNGRPMVDNGHIAQTIQPMIVAFDHYDLETPINGKTKSLLTVYTKDCLLEPGTMMNKDYEHYICGWKNQPRREWCNTNVFNSFPQQLQDIIKPVVRNVQATGGSGDFSQRENVVDKVFFPESKELGDTQGGGTTYSYFDDNEKRIKNINGQSGNYWLGNDGYSSRSDVYLCRQSAVSATGTFIKDGYGEGILRISSNTAGLAFAFCI